MVLGGQRAADRLAGAVIVPDRGGQGHDPFDDPDGGRPRRFWRRVVRGGLAKLFHWVNAPSTLGSFLRAFTRGHVRQLQVTARLTVRRVKRPNPTTVPEGQGELLAAHRRHALRTDSPLTITRAEPNHRRHAVIEQVFSDIEAGTPGHLPFGNFQAGVARLTLADRHYAKATGATLRRNLINIPDPVDTHRTPPDPDLSADTVSPDHDRGPRRPPPGRPPLPTKQPRRLGGQKISVLKSAQWIGGDCPR